MLEHWVLAKIIRMRRRNVRVIYDLTSNDKDEYVKFELYKEDLSNGVDNVKDTIMTS